jgi:hypothetical protein
MDTVNELLQNIRFLKYYGWGQYIYDRAKRETYTPIHEQRITGLIKHGGHEKTS